MGSIWESQPITFNNLELLLFEIFPKRVMSFLQIIHEISDHFDAKT